MLINASNHEKICFSKIIIVNPVGWMMVEVSVSEVKISTLLNLLTRTPFVIHLPLKLFDILIRCCCCCLLFFKLSRFSANI